MYKTLINHQEIKDWAESKQGTPAIIDAPDAGSDKIGLRLDFPGLNDSALLARAKPSKTVTWNEFFEIFDSQKLAFVIDSQNRGSDWSSTYRFIKRENLNNSEKIQDQESLQKKVKQVEEALGISA